MYFVLLLPLPLPLPLLPLPRNHAKDEPPRHTKTPPNFVPKRRQKGTAKLPNVPSESLEKNYKSRNTHAPLLQLLLLPLPQTHAKDEPPRHTNLLLRLLRVKLLNVRAEFLKYTSQILATFPPKYSRPSGTTRNPQTPPRATQETPCISSRQQITMPL